MSKRSGDVTLEEAQYVNACGRKSPVMHSPDCSYAQLQCRKQGLKRRASTCLSDATTISPVKVEDPSFESPKMQNTERSVRKMRLAILGAPMTPDVSCMQGQRDEGNVANAASHGSDDSLCREALQAELHRRTEELLVTQGQRDAAIAEMRVHLVHHSKHIRSIETELQAELWRTTEEIKVARKQRDDANAGKQVRLVETLCVTLAAR